MVELLSVSSFSLKMGSIWCTTVRTQQEYNFDHYSIVMQQLLKPTRLSMLKSSTKVANMLEHQIKVYHECMSSLSLMNILGTLEYVNAYLLMFQIGLHCKSVVCGLVPCGLDILPSRC